MGWVETCAVEERMRFVLAVERGEEPLATLCRRFGVSRRIGYKRLGRYREEGMAGWPIVLDRFRAFRRLDNEARPHQALANDTPAEHYAPSPRRFAGVLREPEYPQGHAVRRVRSNGEIK